MPHRRRLAARGLALAGTTALIGLCLPGGNAGATSPSPTAVTPFDAQVLDVTAASADSAWMVGYQLDGDDVFLDHWDGTSWQNQAHPPASSSAAFIGVSASSASDVWAVGSHYVGPKGGRDTWTYVQHFDGSAWSRVKAANPSVNNDVLSAVAARTTTDAWAVGFQSATASSPAFPLLEHWDGDRWRATASPALGQGCYGGLTGVSAITADDAWAVGAKSCGDVTTTVVEHWNGSKWSIVRSPNPGGKHFNLLNKVTAVSSDDVWAVGAYGNGGPATHPLMLHWDGHSWTVVQVPSGTGAHCATPGASLIGVGTDGSDVWAVGGRFCGQRVNTLVLRWTGSSWKVSPSPGLHQSTPPFEELESVAVVNGRAAFAVGNADTGSGSIGFAQRWDGHTWSLY